MPAEGTYGSFGVEYQIDAREAVKAAKSFEQGLQRNQALVESIAKSLPEIGKQAGNVFRKHVLPFFIPDLSLGKKIIQAPVKAIKKLMSRGETLLGVAAIGDTAYLQDQLQKLNTTVFSGRENIKKLSKSVLDLSISMNISQDTTIEAIGSLGRYGKALIHNEELINKQTKTVLRSAIMMQDAWNLSIDEGIQLQVTLTKEFGLSIPEMNKYIGRMKSLADATGQTMAEITALFREVKTLTAILRPENRASFTKGLTETVSQLESMQINLRDLAFEFVDIQNPILAADKIWKFSFLGISPEEAKTPLIALRKIAQNIKTMDLGQLEALGVLSRDQIVNLQELNALSEKDFQLRLKEVNLEKDWNKARSTLIDSTKRIGRAMRGMWRGALLPLVNSMAKLMNLTAGVVEGFAKMINIISKFTYGVGGPALAFISAFLIQWGLMVLKFKIIKKAIEGVGLLISSYAGHTDIVIKFTDAINRLHKFLALSPFSRAFKYILAPFKLIKDSFVFIIEKFAPVKGALGTLGKSFGFFGKVLGAFSTVLIVFSLIKESIIFTVIIFKGLVKVVSLVVNKIKDMFSVFKPKDTKRISGFFSVIFNWLKRMGPIIKIISIVLGAAMLFNPVTAAIFGVITAINIIVMNWGVLTDSFKSGLVQMGKGFIKLGKVILKALLAPFQILFHMASGIFHLVSLKPGKALASFKKAFFMPTAIAGETIEAFGDIAVGLGKTVKAAVTDGVIDANKKEEARKRGAIDIPRFNLIGLRSGQQLAFIAETKKTNDLIKQHIAATENGTAETNRSIKENATKVSVSQKRVVQSDLGTATFNGAIDVREEKTTGSNILFN